MFRWFNLLLMSFLLNTSVYARTELTFSKNEALLNQLSKSFMGKLYQSGRLIQDPLSQEYLQHIADRLVLKTNDKHHRYRFFLLNAKEINAFAAPGGSIVVNTGLLVAAKTPDEIAAVLAHEIMHVKQDHLLQNLDHAEQSTIPLIANALAAVALGMLNPALGSGLLMMGTAGIQQGELNYTREHEADSDHLGIQVLYAAGFNPRSMASFFSRLQQESRLYDSENVPALLRSHPLNTLRIAEAEDRARSFPLKSYPIDPMYLYFQERVKVESHHNPQQLLAEYQRTIALGGETSVTVYGMALAANRAMQFSTAYNTLSDLHKKLPNNEFISLGLVDNFLESNQIKPGLGLMEQLLKEQPNHSLFQNYGARVYFYAHQPTPALALLDSLIKKNPENTQYWFLKAETHRLAHQSAEAYYAFAQALYLESMDKTALKHFRHAFTYSAKSSPTHQLAQQKIEMLSR